MPAIPSESNGADFGTITDVRVTFYFKARFEGVLAMEVRGILAGVDRVN